jgi:tryptophan synthase alpha chain
LPELPVEEQKKFTPLFDTAGMANILLVTPTTPAARVAQIDRASNGFLYCVSTTGVTGSAKTALNGKYFGTVKRAAKKNPVLVGFGIKTPADAHRAAQHTDGVIVGSALLRKVAEGKSPRVIDAYVRSLKTGMENQR